MTGNKDKVIFTVAFTGKYLKRGKEIKKYLNKLKRTKGIGKTSPFDNLNSKWKFGYCTFGQNVLCQVHKDESKTYICLNCEIDGIGDSYTYQKNIENLENLIKVQKAKISELDREIDDLLYVDAFDRMYKTFCEGKQEWNEEAGKFHARPYDDSRIAKILCTEKWAKAKAEEVFVSPQECEKHKAENYQAWLACQEFKAGEFEVKGQ